MNWTELLSSMDSDHFDNLDSAVRAERRRREEVEAERLPPPNEYEVSLIKFNRVDAIKTYKTRIGCTLMVAKAKIDKVAG